MVSVALKKESAGSAPTGLLVGTDPALRGDAVVLVGLARFVVGYLARSQTSRAVRPRRAMVTLWAQTQKAGVRISRCSKG
ncbi:hypothetical protein GCM10009759_27750 [Kitasatospora saccharophila]|uniref:Uncharacterized protein n=1 Tax=Kitasatospora saccharophila TaxID=407973 RepID=A0ABP5ICX0_9ACTN